MPTPDAIRLLPIVAVLLATGGGSADPPAVPADASSGRWLLDCGLAYGLNVAAPTPANAEYVLIWLDAATAVSPGLAEAYLWKYDLLTRLQQADEARTALAAYCRADPGDISAVLNLVDLEFVAAQTTEDRLAVCQRRLEDGDLAPEVASDLHHRLAVLHAGRGEPDEARREAERALQRFGRNLPAQGLLAELEGRLDQPGTRVGLLLGEIGSDPASGAALWRLARALDEWGLFEESRPWYAAAERAFTRQDPDAPPPAELRLDQARSAFAAGEDEKAASLCTDLLAGQPSNFEAEALLIRATRRLGRSALAERHAAALAARLREREPSAVAERDALTCYQIARFHLDVQPEPRRAVEFARQARDFAPRDEGVRALLGRALVAAGDYAEAADVLAPLIATDVRAALDFAQAQVSLGDTEAARRALRTAESLNGAGPERDRVVELLRVIDETPAPPPDLGEVRQALAGFDRDVLDFPEKAAETLDFEVALDAAAYSLAAPVTARFTLRNKGASAVTIGVGRMLAGRVAVTLADTARNGPRLEAYLEVRLDRKYVLDPGDSIDVEHRLDTTLARALLDHQPQRRRVFEFTFVLDPQTNADGTLGSALAGVQPVTRRVTRIPVDATPEGLARLTKTLKSGDEAQRMAAVDTLLALIQERYEFLSDKPHTYAANNIDPERLTDELRGALGDDSANVRARTLWALAQLPLADQTIAAVAPLITDPDWLPRLLAADLFARRQGQVFLPVLKSLADDGNPLVARLAGWYADELSQQAPARRGRH